MTTSPDQETLVGLVNQLNLPYTLASTTDDQRELRRRIAFARRIQAAQGPLKDFPSKIDTAKSFLAAYRMQDDLGKLLGYLGGRLEDIGDYAHDLKQLAPVVRRAADNEVEVALQYSHLTHMRSDLTDEEKGYLSKVLKTPVHHVKQCVVATVTDPEPRQQLQLLAKGSYPSIADAWAAACAVHPTEAESVRTAVVPSPLAGYLKGLNDHTVTVDVTQLDPEGRFEVAKNLEAELRLDRTDLRAAITRAFA